MKPSWWPRWAPVLAAACWDDWMLAARRSDSPGGSLCLWPLWQTHLWGFSAPWRVEGVGLREGQSGPRWKSLLLSSAVRLPGHQAVRSRRQWRTEARTCTEGHRAHGEMSRISLLLRTSESQRPGPCRQAHRPGLQAAALRPRLHPACSHALHRLTFGIAGLWRPEEALQGRVTGILSLEVGAGRH